MSAKRENTGVKKGSTDSIDSRHGDVDGLQVTLNDLDEVIDAHSSVLEALERSVTLKDTESLLKTLSSARRLRKEMKKSVTSLSHNFSIMPESQVKEQVKGILGYLYLVGLSEEMELLAKAAELMGKLDPVEERKVREDMKAVKEIRDPLAQISF
ncbi:hypothetical protein HS1genome_0178 [Sulfodiicoccus acidiphilus]|uniref:Uncharacterized protein n=1 Tax=Sulfodiicoccus acidiphilus TaxID=1670455 RepID=A0A348B0T7_9CREN|nr:hypothetical protein [Sulfodiicoccus acidiphilus]BBD71789.1 hypothetical protein HS1genome_0178 [Sulfodiicoccus acidiphilus]GGT99206.1 hypothetical protein GCM10007116_15710 [Sulfodiicoccus acidiphilus]